MKQLILFILLTSTFLHAATISIVAKENCPYYCADTAKNKGFVVDIVAAVFDKTGYKVAYTSLDSFEDAITDVRANRFDAILGSSPKKTPDFIFPSHPIAYSYDVILVSKHSLWRYQSPVSLNRLTLGVVRNQEYDTIIDKHISAHQYDSSKIQFSGGKYAKKRNLHKLKEKKITALVDNQHAVQYFFAQKKKLFPFKVAKKLKATPINIAFSSKDYKSDRYAKIFSRGLRKLRGTPEMKSLLAKYGLIEKNIAMPRQKGAFER